MAGTKTGVATQIKVINVRNNALLSTRGKFSCFRFSLSHECQKKHVPNWAENLQVDQKVSEIKKLNNMIQAREWRTLESILNIFKQ